MEDINRIPPHSVESEQSILGSIILDKEAIITVAETIQPIDFYKEAHKIIYESMLKLNSNNEPIDLITLIEELRKEGHLDSIGGISYLTSLSTIVPTTSNVKYYANIVKEKSVMRQLIKASNEIINLGYDASTDVQEILDKAEKNIFDISQEKSGDDIQPINVVLQDTFEMIEKLCTDKSEVTGITTGFADLNKKINGLQRTDLILLAARPAMGKTAFALSLARNAAVKGKASVMIFSLEMAKEQLTQRLLSMESKVDLQTLKTGRLERRDWDDLNVALDILSNSNIHIDDTAGISIMEMKSKCRRLKAEAGLDLVIIDYLQLMNPEGKADSRTQEISVISRNLKLLARELDCPVLVLSQLSRAPEQRTDHRPMLSDLRESGSIEQDADIVIFLYRDEYYNKEDTEKPGECEVIVAKHRSGPTGSVDVAWIERYTQFKDKASGNIPDAGGMF